MSRDKKVVEVLEFIEAQIQDHPDAWNQDRSDSCMAGYTIMIHDKWLFREWELSIPEAMDWSNERLRLEYSLPTFVFKRHGQLIEDYAGSLLEVDPAACWEIFSHNDDCWYSYKELIGIPKGRVLSFAEFCELVTVLTGVEYTPASEGDSNE